MVFGAGHAREHASFDNSTLSHVGEMDKKVAIAGLGAVVSTGTSLAAEGAGAAGVVGHIEAVAATSTSADVERTATDTVNGQKTTRNTLVLRRKVLSVGAVSAGIGAVASDADGAAAVLHSETKVASSAGRSAVKSGASGRDKLAVAVDKLVALVACDTVINVDAGVAVSLATLARIVVSVQVHVDGTLQTNIRVTAVASSAGSKALGTVHGASQLDKTVITFFGVAVAGPVLITFVAVRSTGHAGAPGLDLGDVGVAAHVEGGGVSAGAVGGESRVGRDAVQGVVVITRGTNAGSQTTHVA